MRFSADIMDGATRTDILVTEHFWAESLTEAEEWLRDYIDSNENLPLGKAYFCYYVRETSEGDLMAFECTFVKRKKNEMFKT